MRRLLLPPVVQFLVLGLFWAHPAAAQSGIGFVQVAAALPQGAQSSVAATFATAQTAGNLNVVVVGWNDTTAQVQSVTDTRGNVYVRAVGPTVRSGLGTQSIYYASNIAAAPAAGNVVTATFNVPAQIVDMRIAEYRGIRLTSPVDVVAAAQGSSSSNSSGAVTTTNANDLIVGANLVGKKTTAAGASFTSRIITNPDGDILEDRIVTTVGSYSATASTTGGGYIMQMVAFRGVPADAQAPTAPSGLTANAATSSQVTLGWTASTDNVAVTNYLVERCQGAACSNFAQIGTSSTLAYTDGTVVGSTSYSYRVRATDAAGNLSAYSNIATTTTPAPPDALSPTTPGGLTATAASSAQVNIGWTASTDNVAVTGYLIERCLGTSCVNFVQIGTSPSAGYADTTVAASSTYRYRVRATDAVSNLSGYSNTASATTPGTPDTQAPTAPGGVTATAVSSSHVTVDWTASTDNAGVTNYLVERCQGTGCASFAQIGTSTTVSYSDTAVSGSTSYSYRVRATDAAANLSAYSNETSVTTPVAPDTQAPTAPAGLTASAAIGQATLSWSASTDNVGVTNYLVERCQGAGCASFAQIGTSSTPGYSDTAVADGATYRYRVRATDAATNLSGYSNIATATIPDTEAPTVPATLTATAPSSSQVTLGWTASTDNVAVTNYLVDRCQGISCVNFAQIGTSATTGYTDPTATAAVSYSYRVRATDAAANLSGYSNVASVTTPAPAGIMLVQHTSKDAGTVNSSTLAFASANATGNWIGVAIRASQTNQVFAVSDTRGNTYRKAIQLNETVDGTTLALYYAENVAAGANTITVSTSLTGTLRFAILEYSGVATANSLDAATSAQGTSAAPSSGTVTTTAGGDLAIGLASTANATTFTAGSGFTIEERVPAAPNSKLLVQDRLVASPGAVASSTTLVASDNWGALIVAFKAAVAAPDTQAPTAPGGATATAGSSTQVTVSWTGSSDNIGVTNYLVERCQGVSCASFAQVGTSATLSYSDTTVLGSISYSYRVRATDAAANLSGYSNVANVTTPAPPDTQAPTAPATLSATAVSSSQIDLSWPAATDNIGVTQYLIERCQGPGCTTFAQISTTGSLTFSNTGLTTGASYRYRVRATDAANNLGPYSPVAGATPLDTQAPTTPSTLTATAVSASRIDLSWPAATDNVGVTQYLIERCQDAGCTLFTQVATTAGLTFSNTGLASGTSYSYQVRATDAAGNFGAYSPVASATTPAPDTEVPTAPATLTATATSGTQIDLSWAASTDNVAVTQYQIERCQGVNCTTFAQMATTAGLTFGNTGLTNGASYTYSVRATDAAGNFGPYSPEAGATTPDTQAPAAPATLTATAMSASQIDLSWGAATDNVGVTQYLIERCQGVGCTTFGSIAATTSLTFSNSGLTNGTTYGYRVRAADAANNTGQYSAVATAMTTDTDGPTAPSTLTATAVSSSRIDLSWPAATDNVAVTQYLVERCQNAGCTTFAQIATTTSTAFSSIGLAIGTSYSYQVRATDAAGNLGPYSPVASATTQTQDTQAPTAPFTLNSQAVSSNQVTLSWPAASDNVGVTQYLIERCQGAGCTTFAQIATTGALTFNNTGLTTGATYSYRVRATDAAGNLGPYSPLANSTTPGPATIAFVQTANAVPQSSPTTVPITFAQPQTAGNLNVVVVGWNSPSGSVQSVQDSLGNVYSLAVGPTVRSGFATQSIYYAPGIRGAAANANTVTVTFAAAVPYPDIRIAEYAGIATTSPVDVVAAAQGSGTSSNSGTGTTTNAYDLIVGANMVSSATTGPGASFTSRVITVPDGDILEDRIVTTTGAYSAVAPIFSGAWIMQMVAFKGGNAVVDLQPPTPPSNVVATATSPSEVTVSWTASTDNVGVVGYRVERCQGAGCSTFGEVGTVTTGTGFNDSGLTSSISYSYRLRAVDQAGNYSNYSAQAGVTTPAPDTEPPSAPTNLTATAASGTRIDLTWTASTDNVAVASYRVERCQGAGCTLYVKLATVFSPSFSDIGLTPNTTYQYVVRAVDGSSNLGDYSNEAAATTLATIPELVAAYSFDEGGGTTVTDLSDKGNTGAIGAAVWSATGKYGNALSFNGTSAKVVIPDSASLRLTTAMTLEAWVNPTAGNSGWVDIVYKGDDNYFLEASTNSGVPAAGATLGNVNTVASALTSLPINTWTHLAETYDGTTLRLYINGALAASAVRSGLILTSANPLEIGGDRIYGQYFSGLIDEVRVFNVARTPSQIQADMNTPLGTSLPVMNLSATALDFGSQQTGHVSPAQVITVQNLGGVPMTLGTITMGGFNSADFAYTTTCGTTLAPSGACSITVTFTPAAAGARTAALSISDNAPGAPHTVTLSGSGVGFTISPRTATLTPSVTQQFTWTGGAPDVTFTVDGVPSGNAAIGTVSPTGLYTPPSGAGVHVVGVTSADGTQTSSATVYITTHPGVFTHHNDNARTGQNVAETVLTPASVTSATFGKLASFTLDGIAHASPLYVSGVTVPGKGVHNVVYVATEHNTVYAFDADGLSASPLWQVSFLSGNATTVPSGDTGECCDIAPEIGITGTPVIDPSTGTLYVVAKTKEGNGQNAVYRQRLHALDITTGAEKFGGPVILQASVAGSGGGSQGGAVPFDALHENQRPALLLSNGVVYITFGSHGDVQPYHGWVLGYSAATLQQVMAFNSSPNADGAGLWMANGGPAADAAGNIYAITGNGRFDANTNGRNYGTSFLKLSPSGAVLDYFTPYDQSTSSVSNFDLGAAGAMLLPDQPGPHPHLIIGAGKDNAVYLLDRDAMGQYNANNNNQIVQSLVNIFPFGTPEPGNYSSPVYFNGTVFFGPVADTIQAFTLTNGLLSTSPTSSTSMAFSYPGASLSVSANGTANGIVWAIQRNGDCGVQSTCGSAAPGVLRAYDATNLGIQLYASDQAGTRDQLDFAAKFSVPVVVNGKVFVTTTGRLTIFGLLQ